MLRLFFTCFSLIALCACDQVEKKLGLKSSAPDEFTVSPRGHSLVIPPDIGILPPPKPKAADRPFPSLQGHEANTHTLTEAEKSLLNSAHSSENPKASKT